MTDQPTPPPTCPHCGSQYTIWLKPKQLHCQACGKTSQVK